MSNDAGKVVIIYRQNIEADIKAGKAGAPKRDVMRVLHRNPDRWAGEVEPCNVCVIVGDYPKIAEAYEQAGIEVRTVRKPTKQEVSDGMQNAEEPSEPEKETDEAPSQDADGVVVGDDVAVGE